MRRWHLFEIEDQRWLPDQLRNLITDLLQYQLIALRVYEPVVPKLKELIRITNCERIIDLCSGGGGALLQIQEILAQEKQPVSIMMTDKYPNLEAFRRVRRLSNGQIDFYPESIDATSVPDNLEGIRTLFTCFHHFRPDVGRKILQDAVDKKFAIGIFEFTERKISNVIKMILFAPIIVLFQTPFVRPFKWSRLVLSYIIPLAPFIYSWDALVSHLRTYSVEELREMTPGLEREDYRFDINKLNLGNRGISITYLIGRPTSTIGNW
ncbi:hypothetical protein [Candidatus Thiosymbion oneisti]|uniref:hypothetical protein n=1 Tax=Candidatus Thiosymbion oneisti TaxID=589554 RepID=UPI00105B29D5|nr:hypothetical protein [Candidatus Thiosymbion oneisti]